jgi:flagellar protein FliS
MNDHYKAYHRASHTVSNTRQVVMLYDGAIRFLQQAAEAIEKKDYETRYNKLTRVSDIVIGLQSCLDFDVGGDSAKILYDFYSAIDLRIFALHRSNDLKECQAVIAQMKEMREVWQNIDRGAETKQPAVVEQSAPVANDSVTVSA